MKNIIFIILALISFNGSAQQWEWAKRINGVQNDYVSDMYIDDSAFIYVTGRTKGVAIFEDDTNPITPVNYGHTDAFMAKYDKDGNLIWANQGGSPFPEWGWGIVADQWGNVYCTGEISDTSVFGLDTVISAGDRDVFITKLDRNGEFIWTKRFGNTGNDRGKDITIDSRGDIYVTGFMQDEVTIDGTTIGTTGVRNAFIVKLDSSGNYVHIKSIEPKYAEGKHIEADMNGSIYLTGELLYNNYISGYEVLGSTGLSWRDGFIAKLDTSLQTQWVELVAGSFLNSGTGLAISNNYVYMTGFYSYTADFSGTSLTYNGDGTNTTTILSSGDAFVSKYDFEGNHKWVKGFGGVDLETSHGIAVSRNDDIYFGGTFEDTVMFGSYELISKGLKDMFVTKLDSLGNVIWAKSQGNFAHDYLYAIGIDSVQNIYCGGTYSNDELFDTIQMYSPTNNFSGLVSKLTQHTYPTITLNDTVFCNLDTLTFKIEAITSPLNYEFNLSNSTGWSENEYFHVITNGNETITGEIIVSNNIYKDTILINQLIVSNTATDFTLGNDTTTCDFTNTITLTTPVNQSSYFWSTNETSQSISVSQSDIFWVEITNQENCVSRDSISVNFVDCNTITENNNNDDLLISIQSGYIYLSTSKNEIQNVTLYNMTGKEIHSTQQSYIDTNSIPPGLYILNCQINNVIETYKIIIP